MKKTLAIVAALTLSVAAQAQDNAGALSAKALQKMEQAQAANPTNRALFNAVSTNSIDNLVRNYETQGPVDNHFSVETPAQNIHNQRSSGRCWMFSGLNVLRSDFALQHKDTLAVEFSHVYLFFYDQLEKSNLMLEGAIETAKKPLDDAEVQFFFHHPLNDGGTFCGVADLTAKYGLVPMCVQRETYTAENTSRIRAIISSKLREYGLQLRQMVNEGKKMADVRARKEEQLQTIYRMLALVYGEPVKEFTYAHRNKKGQVVGEPKTYTPQSFYQEVVGRKLNGTFVMVMNDPRHPYHQVYEIKYDRHTYDGTNWRYLNLPMDEIAQLAITALKDGRKMYSSYDVSKQSDRKLGYNDLTNYDYATFFDTTFPMNKAERIATFDSGSTHAMTLTAVDLDKDGKPLKWKVENSWGADSGVKGCLIMTNDWFNEYMFRLVVDKKYVPAQLIKEFDQKPTLLAPQDPLFADE